MTHAQSLGHLVGSAGKDLLRPSEADQAQLRLLRLLLPLETQRPPPRVLGALGTACPQRGLKPAVGVGHSWAAKGFGRTMSGIIPNDVCSVAATGFSVHRPGPESQLLTGGWGEPLTRDVTSLNLSSIICKMGLRVVFVGWLCHSLEHLQGKHSAAAQGVS